MRVGIVEDDKDVAFLMRLLLERHDHDVFVFRSGIDAQEDPDAWGHVDLAIIDYFLEERVTGADVVYWLNSATEFAGRIMVVTGVPHLWHEQAAQDPALEVDTVLGKVFHTEDFLGAVNLLTGAGT